MAIRQHPNTGCCPLLAKSVGLAAYPKPGIVQALLAVGVFAARAMQGRRTPKPHTFYILDAYAINLYNPSLSRRQPMPNTPCGYGSNKGRVMARQACLFQPYQKNTAMNHPVPILSPIGLLCLLLALPAGAQYINFAEALQKPLYFYDAQKSGPGITGGRLDWRGDSGVADASLSLTTATTNLSQAFIDRHRAVLDPDGDGLVDVGGGYHDAGDHVKFGLPQTYSAATLGWAYYEIGQAFAQTGTSAHPASLCGRQGGPTCLGKPRACAGQRKNTVWRPAAARRVHALRGLWAARGHHKNH